MNTYYVHAEGSVLIVVADSYNSNFDTGELSFCIGTEQTAIFARGKWTAVIKEMVMSDQRMTETLSVAAARSVYGLTPSGTLRE